MLDDEHTVMLAIDQNKGVDRAAAVLIIQRCDCNDRWHCKEIQNNNNTHGTTSQSIKTASPEPCGNIEDKATVV